MQYELRSFMAWLLAGAAVVGLGCRDNGNGQQPPKTNSQITRANNGAVSPKGKIPSPADVVRKEHPPLPLEIPKVGMTEEDRKKCRVYVGDPMPEATLPDLEGKDHRLRDLYGEKLTVILFWSSQNAYAIEALSLVGGHVAEYRESHSEKEASVIGINVGDSPEVARRVVEEQGTEFINLLDTDGTFFCEEVTFFSREDIRKGMMPRVYLVDHEGTILWLDDEYSTTTQDALKQGIRAVLGAKEVPGDAKGVPADAEGGPADAKGGSSTES
jgi:peroxiredoxin